MNIFKLIIKKFCTFKSDLVLKFSEFTFFDLNLNLKENLVFNQILYSRSSLSAAYKQQNAIE